MHIVYLNDDEVARINIKLGLQIKTVSNKKITPFVQELALSIEDIEKGGFDYFMLKKFVNGLKYKEYFKRTNHSTK